MTDSPLQMEFTWQSPEERAEGLRAYSNVLGLADRAVRVLEVVTARGTDYELDGQRLSKLTISEAKAAQAMGCARGTWRRGVADLAAAEVLIVTGDGTPWTYRVNWTRVGKLQAAKIEDAAESTKLADTNWSPIGPKSVTNPPQIGHQSATNRSPPVTPGHPRIDPLLASLSKDSLESLSLESLSSLLPMGDLLSHRRPWDVVEDNHLVASINSGNTRLPWRLYEEGLKAPKKGDPTKTWWEDSEDNRLRFMAIFHHSAKASGIHSRIAMLKGRCGKGLDSGGIAHDHEQWATGVVSRANAAPATGEAARACEAMAEACRPDRATREHGDGHAEQ